MLVVLPFVGGRTPGGADPVNERSLSAFWRNSAVVSGLACAASQSASLLPRELSRILHGSLECLLLAMLICVNLTGNSGPAKESRLTCGGCPSSLDCFFLRALLALRTLSCSEMPPLIRGARVLPASVDHRYLKVTGCCREIVPPPPDT